jgi:hypothetical protein
MRSLHRLSPVLVICTVFMLGMFAGCGSSDDPVVVTPPVVETPNGGYFEVFADMGGADCNLQDPGTGTVSYYILHMGTEGATAAEFEVEFVGFSPVVGMTSPFQTAIINQQAGTFTLAYGACMPSPVHVATLTFSGSRVAAPACASVRIVPDPISGRIGVVDCDQNYLEATSLVSHFNNDGNCPCAGMNSPASQDWPKIKNIFQD